MGPYCTPYPGYLYPIRHKHIARAQAVKPFVFDIALLFLFGLLVLILRYTGGKGFGVISGEQENGPSVGRVSSS